MGNNLNLSIKLTADGSVLNATLKDAKGNLSQLGSVGKQAGDSINTGISSASAGMQSISTQLQRVKSELVGIVSVAGLAGLAKAFVDTADAINSLNARLKLATKSTQEYTAAKSEIVAIALRTGQSLESVGTLYAKVADSMRQLGASQKDTLRFTEATAKAMRISGASASSAEAGITQLSQALASGVLRGDEFNSIMENSPRLAQAMADGLGIPRGALRNMAEEGKLTADVVTKAILSQSAALSGEFSKLPVTVGQAFTNLRTSMMLWVEQVDTSTGITGKFAAALDWLSKNLNLVMSTITTIASVALPALALRAIPAVIAGFAAIGTALAPVIAEFKYLQGATLAGGIAAVGALKTASMGLMAAWTGWEIGTWARENFEVVRLAGVAMASGLHVAFATLTGASEAEIQAIRDGYFGVFQASTDKAQQASAVSAAASAAAVAKTKAQLEEEAAAYKALTTTIKANYDQRLADISASLQQQLALIDATETNESARESAKTAAIMAAHTERLAAIKVYQTEILKLIEQERDARLAASKMSGESEKQINLDALNARRAALADILKDYQAHFNDLSSQYSAHLAHVQQIEQAKRDAVAGVEATIRDLARETMDARSAYSDKQKEIDELQSKARQALAEGDFKKAQEYADKSIQLAKSTANEVRDADGVVIEKRQAVSTATQQVKESLDLMKKAYDGQGDAAKKESDKTALAMKEAGVNVTDLKNAIAALDQQLASQHALTIKTNVDEVKASISSLNGMNTRSTHTVVEKRVPAAANGGPIGFSRGGPVLRFATGGQVAQAVQRFATGGPVFKRPSWLKVPGSGNGDTEPAALDAGSYVIKKSASQYYGDGLMGAVARGVQKFALGGFADPIKSAFFDGAGEGFGAKANSDIAKKIAVIQRAAGLINSYNRRHRVMADWIQDYLGQEVLLAASRGDKDAEKKVAEFYLKSVSAALDVAEYMGKGTTGVKDVWAFLGIPKMPTKIGARNNNRYADPSNYATGGPVGTDTVPAMLTPGEWVVKRSAVAKYGLGFLDALNNMRIPRAALSGIGAPPVARYASGGLVGGSAPTSSAGDDGQTVHVKFSAPNGQTATGLFGRRDVQAMLDVLKLSGARAVPVR